MTYLLFSSLKLFPPPYLGPVYLEIGAMSFGGGGTQAPVAADKMPTIEISIAAKADGVELNIPDNMIAKGTEELPMAMDIRGRLLDKSETISEIKVTVDLPDGTSGGLVVMLVKVLVEIWVFLTWVSMIMKMSFKRLSK